MEWFKHYAGSLDDPDIIDAMDKFGDKGYTIFFGTLEIMSKEFKGKPENFYKLSWKFLRKKLRTSQKLLEKIYNFYKKRGRFVLKGNRQNPEFIYIKCPKFIKIIDEWQRRKLRTNSVVPPKESRADNKDNKDSKDDVDFPRFLSSFKAYHKKETGTDIATDKFDEQDLEKWFNDIERKKLMKAIKYIYANYNKDKYMTVKVIKKHINEALQEENENEN